MHYPEMTNFFNIDCVNIEIKSTFLTLIVILENKNISELKKYLNEYMFYKKIFN